MRQYPRQVCEEAFVDGKESLGSNRFKQAVEQPAIQIACLVIHPGHYGVCAHCQPSNPFNGLVISHLEDA